MSESTVTLPDGTVLTGEAAELWVKGKIDVQKSMAKTADRLASRGTSLGGPGNFSEMRKQAVEILRKIQ